MFSRKVLERTGFEAVAVMVAAANFHKDFLTYWTGLSTSTTTQCESPSEAHSHQQQQHNGSGGGSGGLQRQNTNYHDLHKQDQQSDSDGDPKTFYGQCLKRQLFQPRLPYPAWDYNWDNRETEMTSQEAMSHARGFHESKKMSRTRHILLVRHGQYDERYKDDRRRRLTPLGRHQAELTGQRLALMMRGGLGNIKKEFAGPCRIRAVYSSDMERAKETARIIASHLPGVPLVEPDPMLNEALPAPMIPIRPDIRAVAEIDANHDRIESAFRKYIHRADGPSDQLDHDGEKTEHHDDDELEEIDAPHQFEVIVCHGNIIRYFFCRALQLPPEAWLRISTFNCSMTYLIIYPNGYVSCRGMGDVGHMGYDTLSFSGSHGYNW